MRSDAERGMDRSGIVHDADFVFSRRVIMDNDTHHVTPATPARLRRARRAEEKVPKKRCQEPFFSGPF
jgi:hypothetical protein